LDPATVQAAVGSRWTVHMVDSTGSTNADLAVPTTADRTVLVAEQQTAGRGRLSRSWVAPAGSGLLFSVALRVGVVPPGRRAWAGALLGLAARRAIIAGTGLPATLKWPNDVLIDDRKVAGLLAEAVGDLVVVGAGINVTTTADELPRPDANSLALAGAERPDRRSLLVTVLREFDGIVEDWLDARGEVLDGRLGAEYRQACGTLGGRVRLALPNGSTVVGTALDVAADGALLVDAGAGPVAYAAGDVVHLRAG
jgi:BirA family biotin operon repressor/biotin-[acetyl-CoA-carboxylase] ligase